ncbi:MAG: DUF1294 domain-containing protein [Pseudoxanthomonas sp.]
MERLGKVSEWNDDRGFGFVAPLDGEPARVFFHVRDYRLDGRRPEVGELVKFTAQRQPDGKWRAQAVRRTVPAAHAAKSPLRSSAPATPRPESVVPGAVATIAYGLLIAWAIRGGRLPFEAVFVVLGLSAITFVAYALDKHAAQTGRWRTPESTLHLLELAGRLARCLGRAAMAAPQITQACLPRDVLGDGGAAWRRAGSVAVDTRVSTRRYPARVVATGCFSPCVFPSASFSPSCC